MKNGLLIVVVIIALVASGLWIASGNNGKQEKEGLPASLDQYYNSTPPDYLINMFMLGDSFMAIGVHLQQGDIVKAKASFNTFSKNYQDSAGRVPEWKKYYDQKVVERLGASLARGDMNAVNETMGEVGAACERCHTLNMPLVWNRYNWMDFRVLKMNTPDGQLSWAEAKMKYLVAGYDGIGVNIDDHNQSGAENSFDLFKVMFDNMNATCSSCHLSSPRYYYVSADVQAMISAMGQEIKKGNLDTARGIQQGIGMESCYRCHVLHMPAQFAKEERK